MKAIIIKSNNKVIGVSKIDEITTKQFLDLQRDVAKTWGDKDEQVIALKNEVSRLGEYAKELEAKINYLGKQIAIDRGEIDADSEEEYVITIEKIKHEQPKPLVSEEEDAYFEEKEESEVTE